MSEGLNSTSNLRRAAARRTPSGQSLPVCVAVPAEIVERYVKDRSDTLDFVFETYPAGIFLRICGDGR